MIILGLHYGHDSSLCVLRDGVVVATLLKERKNRVRHAIGLEWSDVETVLNAAGISSEDVDFCSNTSTQDIEYLFFEPELLSFEIGGRYTHTIPNPYYDQIVTQSNIAAQSYGRKTFMEILKEGQPSLYHQLFAQYVEVDLTRVATAPAFEDFAYAVEWKQTRKLSDIRATNYARLINDSFARSFHLPVTMTLAGRNVPGVLFSHHYAHAAYAYFSSPFTSAAILSHDGGGIRGYRAGMFYWGKDEMLYPITPHYLSLGWTYYAVSTALGLGAVGGQGKLMGLSSYGTPSFFSTDFLGNWFDDPLVGKAKNPECWIAWMLQQAETAGYDMTAFADPHRATEPINADIAMSTQKLFEESILQAVSTLNDALDQSGITEHNLCLTGGTALNCPANSRIASEASYVEVSVSPACDDSGLAMGSAYALYHCLLEQKRKHIQDSPHPEQVYPSINFALGRTYSEHEIRSTLEQFASQLIVEEVAHPEEEAAALLHKGAIIGWFQGRSEVGPRALGHRSILANPMLAENWQRVNRIKGREAWRPLAPMILEDQAADWFSGAPIPSPYMLFTATVLSERIPAVTHVDHSARIQTVSPGNGLLHDLLTAFHRLSGVPVLLNTSLNGPREPIVDTPSDAVHFFINSALDTLFIHQFKLSRKPIPDDLAS